MNISIQTIGKTACSLAIAAAAGLNLSSCVDNNADLNKISSDIYLEGTYSFPIVHADSITIRDILREYGNNSDDAVVLDSLNIGQGTALLALYYHKTFEYGVRSEDGNINESFRKFKDDFSTPTLTLTTPQGDGISYFANRIDLNKDISDKHNSGNTDQYVIHSIQLDNADISLTSEPDHILADSLIIGEGASAQRFKVESGNKLSNVSLSILYNDTITVKYSHNPGTVTDIDIKIDTERGDYTVYGWFDYALNPNKQDTIKADLKTYFGADTWMQFVDPRFEFGITNHSLGVPLILKADTIQTNLQTLDFNSGKGYEFLLTPAKTLDVDTFDFISISKDYADTYKFDADIYSQLFDVSLETAYTGYDLYTDDSKYNTNLDSWDNSATPLQFISSKSRISLDARAVLPFWIRKGKIVYNDTIKSVDLGISDEDSDELNLTDDTEVTIRLTYTNHLPIPLNAELTFLDTDGEPISVDGTVWKESIKIPRGTVNGDGYVTESAKNYVDIDITKKQFDERRTVSKIKLTYTTENDASNNQEIRVRTTDFLTLKVGVKIKGGITVAEKSNVEE
jgi:hypothetical protein